jgi:hypothetical protein
MTHNTLKRINLALNHARSKHPRWVRSRFHYTAVLLEEVAEHLWHVWRGNRDRADEEGLHVVAVILRGEEVGYGS